MPRSAGIVDGPLGSTDLKRWRLDSTDHGRHVWSYQAAEDEPELWAVTQYCVLTEDHADSRSITR